MNIQTIYAIYFSPAGKTREVTETLALRASSLVAGTSSSAPQVISLDFTLPKDRLQRHSFSSQELLLFGMPTYAGRLPNKALPFLRELFCGKDTPVLPLVTFGNRNFDSSLTELCEELGALNFRPFAAAAVPCRHVFSDKLAPGRPRPADWDQLDEFLQRALPRLVSCGHPQELAPPIIRDGQPVGPYYTPLGLDGKPAKFLKAKPITDPSLCQRCGLCSAVCPMGSIDSQDSSQVPGVCIKCHACIHRCPHHAKAFSDPAFLSHVSMLEENHLEPAAPAFFL